ncbi:hypothetical protein KUTeg_022067 [Tegillarca granosa]|uniref:G-protein coupled receptors family 1 profile domain-containing protein n=1 Tax=Tegillarca granosa TaxID=220873 RepID=A0ABQ9E563_TEGGR|nr:hypothetical protein KUTeg_022067 [Tegillarca granosa]
MLRLNLITGDILARLVIEMEYGEIVRRIMDRQTDVMNDSETTLSKIPLQQQEDISIVFLTALAFSCLIGVIGNTMVIGAVIVYKKLRTMGNMFIVNLAIADLIVVTIVEPFNIVGVTVGPSFFLNNLWICHIVSIVCVMACVCSMLNLAAIAINRYILITKSHIYRNIYTKRRTIYRRVSKIKKQLRKISIYSKKDKKRSRKLQDDANLALTFFIVFMSFLICWAPFDLLILIDREDRCPQWVYIFFLQIGHFNSSLNSILYGLTNNRFRDGYSTFFKKICNYKEKKTDEKKVEKGFTDPDNSTNNNLSSGVL